MNKRITQSLNISKLHNPTKPIYIRDTQLQGFAIRINRNGKAVYLAEHKVDGKTKRLTLGSTLLMSVLDAKEQAKEFLSPNYSPASKMSMSLLIKEYLASRSLSKWTIRDYNTLTNYFPDCLISSVTGEQVNKWYAAGSSTPATTDKCFRQLTAVLNYSVKMDYIPSNPCNKIIKRYSSKPRSSYLEPAHQLPAVWSVLNKREGITADILRMYLLTGIRRREIYKAEVKGNVIVIPDTKNGSTHYIPTIELMPLDMFKIRKDDWTRDCRKTLKAICIEAKVPIVTIHDLRRTVASLCSYLGVDLGSIKHLLNHSVKSDITLSHYIQHRTDYLLPVMQKLESYYRGCTFSE